MIDFVIGDAGVKIGFGTDLLGDAHVRQNEEFLIRAEVLTPQQVLASATTVAAEVHVWDNAAMESFFSTLKRPSARRA